jgi:hypothetical protein
MSAVVGLPTGNGARKLMAVSDRLDRKYWSMTIEPSTIWLYFHSAVFQGDMALLAVLGLFVVLRLQQLQTRIDSLSQNIIRYVHDRMTRRDQLDPMDYTDIANLEAQLRNIANEKGQYDSTTRCRAEEILRDPLFLEPSRQYRLTRELRRSVSGDMTRIFPFVVAPAVLSLVALPLYSYLGKRLYWPTVILSIVLSLLALTATIYLARVATRHGAE